MTNVTRTMYKNSCVVNMLEQRDGGYVSIGENHVEYVDIAPIDEKKAIELSGFEGLAIVSNAKSEKVIFGMSVSDFIEKGHIIK